MKALFIGIYHLNEIKRPFKGKKSGGKVSIEW
jgi:hypothetical protein